MITDKMQSGLPSASRGRMQLTKPVQTGNSGLTNPTTPSAPSKNTQIRQENPYATSPGVNVAGSQLGERYNPFEPKRMTEAESNVVDTTIADARAPMAGNGSYSYGVSVNGMNNAPKTRYTADEAAGIIANMDEADLVDLLNRISDGSVKPRSGKQATPGPLTGVGNSQLGGTL